jgi:hypothetical protein
MAILEGHMTKLQAVNDMLWSIGESPVQSLASGLGDAEIAEAILDRVSREIQLKGWQVNTRHGVELTVNASSQFALPVNILKVDTSNPTSGRQTTTPRHSAFINAHMRRAADDSKWLLYDGDNNSETWTDPTTITVTYTQLLEFADLTPALQIFVWTSAAHRFQKGAMGSRVLQEYTTEDVLQAEMQAVQEDSANEDLNIIRDNAHVRSVAYRYNPGYNS